MSVIAPLSQVRDYGLNLLHAALLMAFTTEFNILCDREQLYTLYYQLSSIHILLQRKRLRSFLIPQCPRR